MTTSGLPSWLKSPVAMQNDPCGNGLVARVSNCAHAAAEITGKQKRAVTTQMRRKQKKPKRFMTNSASCRQGDRRLAEFTTDFGVLYLAVLAIVRGWSAPKYPPRRARFLLA